MGAFRSAVTNDSIITIVYHSMSISFLFIGRGPTTWTANNCLQISALRQIIFCSCAIGTSLLCENGRSVSWAVREWFNVLCWSKEQWSNDKTIIELDYRKISWFLSVSQSNSLPQPSALANSSDLHASDKSRYFDQPRSMIVMVVVFACINMFSARLTLILIYLCPRK